MQQKITYLFKKLQGSSLGFQVFTLSRFGFLLLSSIFLARIFPDKVIVEQYEIMLLLGGSCSFFWVSGLFDGFVVLYRKAGNREQNGHLLHTFSAALLFAALSSLAAWGLGHLFLADRLPARLTNAYAVYLFFDLSSLILVYILLVRQRNFLLMVYGALTSFAYFLLLVVPLWQGKSLHFALLLLIGLAVVKFLIMVGFLGRKVLKGRYKKEQWRALIRVSGPLVMAILLSQSAQYVDGYFVESWFPEDFAIFRYGAKELPLILLLANALSLVRSGDIAADLAGKNEENALLRLKNSSLRLMHGLFPFSILLLLVSQPLFEAVFGPGYLGAVPVFDIYLLLVIPRLLFPQSVIRGYQRTLAMTYSAAAELVLNVGLSLLLMQFWGIAGIALATVIAFFVEKLLLVGFVTRALRLSWPAYTPLGAWLAWSLALLVAVILKYSLF